MDGYLSVTTKIIAFADSASGSNPRLKWFDWLRDIPGAPVADPKSEGHIIAPGSSKVIFDGVRATTTDGTTAFALTLSPLDPSRYRFTWTGGTNPGLRTGRNLTLNGVAITFTANINATLTASVPAGPDFTAVQVGDIVFVPHTSTGDAANVISDINAGYWVVLGKASSTSITLVRPSGEDFQGATETVTLTANSQFRAYSTSGVQVDDHVDVSAGFGLATRKAYQIVAATDTFFEVISTTPLAAESGILPGATGMLFYTDNKSFVYIEADQECAVRVNGDLGNYQRLSPVDPSDASKPAQYMKRGPTWSLTIVNLAAVPVNVTVIHCE
jgi:hypothetical protein